ncbi:hypothetical protein EB796_021452 [Bugula neritina]|uniref:Uncharacterized protein n=1 Tax=Bugula neritina TaxID=10212 RepID=A0A7J7J262_BUGNE|nr:hypothetical protein EB796_021452 [Bugula neritina]
MWPSVNSSLLGMLCFVSLLVPVYTAADDTECILPKYINCFNCDSRIHSFCEDKFNKTASISLDHMKRCEGECLKWVRNIDPANPDLGSYIIELARQTFLLICISHQICALMRADQGLGTCALVQKRDVTQQCHLYQPLISHC